MRHPTTLGFALILGNLISSAVAYQFDSAKDPGYPVLLPPPQKITFGNETGLIDPCFFFVNVTVHPSSGVKPEDLKNATIEANIRDYVNTWIFYKGKDCKPVELSSYQASSLSGVSVIITNQTQSLIPSSLEIPADPTQSAESYNLTASAEGIQITAYQYSGALRGLATLSQLIKYGLGHGRYAYYISYMPLNVVDFPRYPYRGFMLDTSRHFYTVDSIKQTLDILSSAKFNVFHWHIVDDDSFPMELASFPNVTKNGAFWKDQVYTAAMMQDVVIYAEKKGIRVVPEFDNPGHIRAVGTDPYFNEAVLCFNKDWASTVPGAFRVKGGPPTGVMDPSNEKSYELLRGIFDDFNTSFPDDMMHLGGDEVITWCFNQSATIAQFKKDHNISNEEELVNYHMNRTREELRQRHPNKKALYWSNLDTFYQRYQNGDILVFWGTSGEIAEMNATYPNQSFVFATGDYYYMDCGFGNKYGNNAWCDPFKTWWRIYQFEPSDYINGTQVLGSEIAVWSELNSDINIHAKNWPRGAAMPDKIWGPLVPTDLVSVVQRQVMFGEYLSLRGIPTSPVTISFCEKFPEKCFAKTTSKTQVANANLATH